jgi:hypothetical protein
MKRIVSGTLCLAASALLTSIAPSVKKLNADAWKEGDLYGAAKITCTKARDTDVGNVTEINLNGAGNGSLAGTGVYFRIKNYTGIDTPLTLKLNSTNGTLIAPKTNVKQTYFDASGNPVDGIAPRAWGNYMMLPASFDGFIYMNYETQMSKIVGDQDFNPASIWRIYIEYSGSYDSYASYAIGDIITDEVKALDTSEIAPEKFTNYFINQASEYQSIEQTPRGEEYMPQGDLKGGVGCKLTGYGGFMIKMGTDANLSDGLYFRMKNDMDREIWPMVHVASNSFTYRVVTASGQKINLYNANGTFNSEITVNEWGYFGIPANFDGFVGFKDYTGFKDDWGTAFDPTKVSAVYFEADTVNFSIGDIFSRTNVVFDGSSRYQAEFGTFTETWTADVITLTQLDGYAIPETPLFDYTKVNYGGDLEGGVVIKAKQNPDNTVFSTASMEFASKLDLSEGEALAFNFKGVGSYVFQMEFVDGSGNVLMLPAASDAAKKPIHFISNGVATSMNHTTGDPNTIHTVAGEGMVVIEKAFLVQKSGETFDWSKLAAININVHTFYDHGINIAFGDFGTVIQEGLTYNQLFDASDITSWSAVYKAKDEFVTVSKFFTPGPSSWIGDVKIIDSLNYKSDEELKENVTYDIGDNACSYNKENDGMFVHIGPYETGHTYGNYMCLGMFDKGVTTDRKEAYRMNGEEKEYAKGITFYAENRSVKEIGMTLQFDEKIPGKSNTERWCVKGYPAMYYAWDVETNAEYILYSKSDQVQIPVGFKGYIRVPFTSYSVPEWNAGQEGVDEVLNLDNFSGNFFLTSDNTRFSDLEYFIKNVGLYFNETEKSSVFNTEHTIKANMGL